MCACACVFTSFFYSCEFAFFLCEHVCTHLRVGVRAFVLNGNKISRVFLLTHLHTHTRTVLEQEVPELSAEELSKLRQYKEGGEDVERFGQV